MNEVHCVCVNLRTKYYLEHLVYDNLKKFSAGYDAPACHHSTLKQED